MSFLKRWRWAVIGVAAIILTVVIALILTRKQIIIIINGEEQKFVTNALTVERLLTLADIPLGEYDYVYPTLKTWLRKDSSIVIEQAAQIQIFADGETYSMLTPERTPVILLAKAGIGLSPDDRILADGVSIALDQALSPAPSHSLQVRRATQITLDDGGQDYHFASAAATLGEALWEQGITLYHSDQLNPSSDTPLEGDPVQANLIRSQALTVRMMAETFQTRAIGPTVGAALTDSGVALQGSDYSIPPENEQLPENGDIQVVRVREEVLLEQEPLPFGAIQQALPDLEIDNTAVVQAGEYGLTAQRVRVVYEAHPASDGWQEVDRQVEDEWVAREPVARISGYGTKIVVRTENVGGTSIEYWRKVEAYATSYSPCRLGVPDYCNTTTASGKQLQQGMIGVIRAWFNMMRGQQVFISGYGFATIEDIGAGVSGRHWVDLGYTDADWVTWSQNVTVYFLTPVPANIMWVLE
ncbi:MAG: DUF348 domain-containing protein [Anaerolineales bacterium]|nr:DUF348 domain-containing protein [Chloroflexota bacterium]MBL6981377.1 DUF348 domain-containing protein [Anaerolineales bacterium]